MQKALFALTARLDETAFIKIKMGYINSVQTRRSRRIRVSLKAEHISESANRPVFIENISEEGMHMVTLHKSAEAPFFPGKNVELKLRLSSGEAIPLICEVKWMSAKTPPDGVTDSVGLEIIDPPSQYVSFVRDLDISQSQI